VLRSGPRKLSYRRRGNRGHNVFSRKLVLLGLGQTLWFAAACTSAKASAPSSSDGGGDEPGASDDAGGPIVIKELNDGGSSGPPPASITCGTTTCNAPTGGMIPLAACCLGDNGCGAMFDLSAIGMGGGAGAMGGGCLDPSPGTADPSCPSQMVMGFSLTGCCSKAGLCGVDLSMAGLGCNSFAALPGFGMAPPATDAQSAAPPQACGAGEAGTEAGAAPVQDAGSD
jgi:hypothetical protein